MTMTDPERAHRTLSGALRAMAAEDAGLGASPAVEATLREAVRAMNHTERGRVSPLFLAAAAALTVIVLGSWRLVAVHTPVVPDAATLEVTTEFLPLAYAHLPVTNVNVIRVEVSRAALLAFGLAAADIPTIDDRALDADVLVGDDGLARAVRFVHYVKGGE
jgi:hypothetical protein